MIETIIHANVKVKIRHNVTAEQIKESLDFCVTSCIPDAEIVETKTMDSKDIFAKEVE